MLAEFIYAISLINGRIWLGTSSGAYCLDLNGAIEGHYFLNEKISDIVKDREGNYWFTSLEKGIFVMPDPDLTVITSANSVLKDDNITALKTLSDGTLLIGTYSGHIYRYTRLGNRLQLLPESQNIAYRNATSFIQYSNDVIIAARGGLSVIDMKRGTDRSYVSQYIRDMVQTGDSIVFVSAVAICAVGSIAGIVGHNTYNLIALKNIAGKNVCYDKKNATLWVTINNGLAIFEDGKFIPFTIGGKPVFCNALYADSSGLWAGTVADGVYNIQGRKVMQHLDNSCGLQGGNVRCIVSSHDTQYIATDVCINIRYPGNRFGYIDYTDGINAKEITALSACGGHLFIGSIRGLYDLPVTASITNTVSPDIAITSVSADGVGKAVNEVVKLSWNSKDILIHFSSVGLRSRGKLTYRYRIVGFQDEWEKLEGSIPYVRLSHLPPGNFTFQVIAVNEDEVVSKQAATLSLAVSSPFWQHWLFYVLTTVGVMSIVVLLAVVRIRKIKRNSEIRNQIVSSQLTALKAQMNPHFMYNTLNSIQDLILQNDIKSTNYYLSRYSSLMRKILESSGNNEIELAEEIEILRLYLELEQLRFGDDFTYSVEIAEAVDPAAISIPSMIIQPFVENAIKHGLLHKKGKKNLQLIFGYDDGVLACIVRDNGVGRVKAEEIKRRSSLRHTSFATKATERRLDLINTSRKHKIILTINDIYENSAAKGTEVRLYISMN